MKQSGKTWIDHEGQSTQVRYVPEFEKAAERIGSKLADLAIAIEQDLQDKRVVFRTLCEEMLQRVKASAPEKQDLKHFSFTTFDRGFKVEVSVLADKTYYRVYQATKPNPSHKDYRLVNTDFSKAIIQEANADFGPEEALVPRFPVTGSQDSIHEEMKNHEKVN